MFPITSFAELISSEWVLVQNVGGHFGQMGVVQRRPRFKDFNQWQVWYDDGHTFTAHHSGIPTEGTLRKIAEGGYSSISAEAAHALIALWAGTNKL